MAQRVRVTCVRKRDRQNPHERIEGIGGGPPPWYMTEDQAIRAIQNGQYTFYVMVNGREVDVEVADHNGRPYLKTKADGYAPNNLLSLPECPR